MTDPLLLPTPEAARVLGVSEETVRRRRRRIGLAPPPRVPTTLVSLRVPSQLLAQVDAVAQERGCSRTALVVTAIEMEVR